MAARKGNYLVSYSEEGTTYKICRIIVAKDASYYVTSSYHRVATATLIKSTVNYTSQNEVLDLENAIDVGFSDDADGKIKLSHHADGFVQFSGDGIVSGRSQVTGEIRGIGVFSFPPSRPVKGPAFGMVFSGVQSFEVTKKQDTISVGFAREDLSSGAGRLVYFLEGHLFPWAWRRFVKISDSRQMHIDIPHPAGAVVSMKVLLPPDEWKIPYFFGFEMYTMPFELLVVPDHSFEFGGPTGNVRKNSEGSILADAIHCIYPKRIGIRGRNMDFGKTRSVYEI